MLVSGRVGMWCTSKLTLPTSHKYPIYPSIRLVTGAVLTKVTAILVEDVVFRHRPLLMKRLCGCGISTSQRSLKLWQECNGMEMASKNKTQNQAQIFRNGQLVFGFNKNQQNSKVFSKNRGIFSDWKVHRTHLQPTPSLHQAVDQFHSFFFW